MANIRLNRTGTMSFLCEGKRVSFYFQLTYGHIIAMCLILLCCIGSICWYLFARNISGLLEKLKNGKQDLIVEFDLDKTHFVINQFDKIRNDVDKSILKMVDVIDWKELAGCHGIGAGT